MRKADPVKEQSSIITADKIKLHESYLAEAIADKNDLHQLYGLFYLISDYYSSSNYVPVNSYLLQAEIIIKKHSRPDWEAAYHFRKALLHVIKNNSNLSLKEYFLAYQKSSIAKDSLYMAESLEQISATYAELDQYTEGEKYFKLALPLLEKFAENGLLAQAYNNYSNLKHYQGDQKKALTYIDMAIKINTKINNPYIASMYRNNKGVILTEMRHYDLAENIFKELEEINRTNKWNDRLISNYLTLAKLYENWGKYKLSIDYYKKYQELKEDVEGSDVKQKMLDLEIRFVNQKKETELKDKQIKITILALLLILLVAILAAVMYLWKKQKKKTQYQFDTKINNLSQLTNLLIEKNNNLIQLNDSKVGNKEKENVPREYLNQKILTDSDWSTFKLYFEKAYPTFIQKIRETFPKITPSEERLFLCLKLNLKNKEIASILGISNESVKKNRNRLRKKINLKIEDDLDIYVRSF